MLRRCTQGHPTENFEKKTYIKKKTNKQKQKQNKTAILAFCEIAWKNLSVPHSQQV